MMESYYSKLTQNIIFHSPSAAADTTIGNVWLQLLSLEHDITSILSIPGVLVSMVVQ